VELVISVPALKAGRGLRQLQEDSTESPTAVESEGDSVDVEVDFDESSAPTISPDEGNVPSDYPSLGGGDGAAGEDDDLSDSSTMSPTTSTTSEASFQVIAAAVERSSGREVPLLRETHAVDMGLSFARYPLVFVDVGDAPILTSGRATVVVRVVFSGPAAAQTLRHSHMQVQFQEEARGLLQVLSLQHKPSYFSV
jgi:hypothetical protein